MLGKPVEKIDADSGDGTPDIAGGEVDNLLSEDVDAIIGAAASGVSVSVIDKITGAGVVHFSPANTAAGFDTYEDNGLYFRTAPSDRAPGPAPGEPRRSRTASRTSPSWVARTSTARVSPRQCVTRSRRRAPRRGVRPVRRGRHEVQRGGHQDRRRKPDALVLVGFEETTKIIPQLIANGIGPQDIQIYFVDGNLADYSEESFDLTGVKGTLPVSADPDPGFNDKLCSSRPQAEGLQLRPAVLRRQRSSSRSRPSRPGDDSGEAVGANIVDVTTGGTQCTTFEECAQLLEDGEDIDYEGASGPTDMNDSGSLQRPARIGINEYRKGNTYEQVDSVSGVVH